MNNVALIGEGGHSSVVIDIINLQQKYKIFAVFDDKYHTLQKHNNCYYGPVSSMKDLKKKNNFKIIVCIGDNKIRKKIINQLNISLESFETFIHPSAQISNKTKIGKGTVIMPNVVINANSNIGNHVILNTSCVIEHDNDIQDFVHISPSATLTGNVKIAEGTHIGANAVLIPGVSVGRWTIIGAGSTVTQNITDECTAVGSPARIIKGI
ncbi:acetyltransferase [Metabacillus halosaccharovorans]|nr:MULTISPECIES: acetyltransferase [Metabacillus]